METQAFRKPSAVLEAPPSISFPIDLVKFEIYRIERGFTYTQYPRLGFDDLIVPNQMLEVI